MSELLCGALLSRCGGSVSDRADRCAFPALSCCSCAAEMRQDRASTELDTANIAAAQSLFDDVRMMAWSSLNGRDQR